MTDIPRPLPEPKRGWKKLLFALFVFMLLPAALRSLLPIDETMMLFVPAMAACALVGWWAGGRMFSALLWIALTVFVARQDVAATSAYGSLVRGWALLLAGAFGVASIVRLDRPFFTKALASVATALVVGLLMTALGPARWSGSVDVVNAEFAQRNAEAMQSVSKTIELNPAQWQDLSSRIPSLADFPNSLQAMLDGTSRIGKLMFPALLALESLAALSLAWATYHRLSRTRIGAPLSPLREFRFNDQLVWGLIVGLVVLVLPNLADARSLGANLVLFFGALYAMRGLGVLAWFMAPGTFAMGLIAGAVLVWVPVVNVIAILGFMTLGVTALGLGVGDTWADWRSRARSTLS